MSQTEEVLKFDHSNLGIRISDIERPWRYFRKSVNNNVRMMLRRMEVAMGK